MTLTDEQLLDIIERRPNKHLIEFGEQQHTRARLHIHGEGMEEHLTEIKGFEKPAFRQLRAEFAQTNKDVFARLQKPAQKVYSARGGVTYYNLNENDGAAEAIDKKIRKGMSIKKWSKDHWFPHYLDDPMGITFMEVDKYMNVYPTYKCITTIYDYQFDGTGFEYIVFKVSNEEKKARKIKENEACFRVVDDAADRMVKIIWDAPDESGKKKGKVEVLDSFINFFYDVPAVVNSTIANPGGEGFISMYHFAYDLADQFLLKMSIKISHEFRHAFAKYWEFGDDCTTCKSSGRVGGKQCPDCLGSGTKIMLKV
jgi:hypothetical protein